MPSSKSSRSSCRSAELDAAPVRTAVYPVPGAIRAASVTDATARWAWLRDDGGPRRARAQGDFRRTRLPAGHRGARRHGRRRRSRSRRGVGSARRSPRRRRVCADRIARGTGSRRPVSALGHREAADAVRTAVHAVPGLAVGGCVRGRHRTRAGRARRDRRSRPGAPRRRCGVVHRAGVSSSIAPESAAGLLAQRRFRDQRMPESAYGATLGPDPWPIEREETP